MYTYSIFVALCLSYFFSSMTITIDNTPICSIYTPDSILQNKEQYRLQFVGERTRYSTCTSAEWFHDNYLAILNFYGDHIITYRFDSTTETFYPIQKITKHNGIKFINGEHLSISPDGTLLAVCDNRGKLNIHTIDKANHLINPIPSTIVHTHGLMHNVQFSPDGHYLAYVSFNNKQTIRVYKIEKNQGNIHLQLVYTQPNHVLPLKPKGIDFTQDSKYVLVLYTPAIVDSRKVPPKHRLVVYPFNKTSGTFGKAVCNLEGDFPSDDIDFFDNDHAFIISDQAHDMLVVYPFNPDTGYIDPHYTLVQNPEAQLDFPHGVAVSPNGKYLVATNYGDDKFNLYKINK